METHSSVTRSSKSKPDESLGVLVGAVAMTSTTAASSSKNYSRPHDVWKLRNQQLVVLNNDDGNDNDGVNDDDDDDNDDDNVSCSTSASMGHGTNEIPVWIRGEQRWISGVTEQTTCNDLVEALLTDEGLQNSERGIPKMSDYVITERWRRVEQILDGRTKILKIWSAWSEAQSEVKLTLRRIEHQKRSSPTVENNCDSGRGSPTGSAIVRRRRHRASKSTTAWITHAQTLHPKTQKATIEKLMKLILEQGETIQQQLAKLRDREIQISRIEEDRHRMREREHGKNYLLETYLNGLHEADDKEITTGNSDSGVHTEDATSPEVGISPILEHEMIDISDVNNKLPITSSSTSISPPSFVYLKKKKSRSHRETELLQNHESAKELSASIEQLSKEDENERNGLMPSSSVDPITMTTITAMAEAAAAATTIDNNNIENQIEMLEKVYILNKHLQREEELLVRLNAKIKRYESENPSLTEQQIIEALERINSEIDYRDTELKKTDHELEISNEIYEVKANMLQQLNAELEAADLETFMLENNSYKREISPAVPLNLDHIIPEKNLNLSQEYLAENIYNISKIILKNSVPAVKSNSNNINENINIRKDDVMTFIRHTPENELCYLPNSAIQSIDNNKYLPNPVNFTETIHQPPPQFMTEVQVHPAPFVTVRPPPAFMDLTTFDLITSMNILQKCDQHNINNVLSATNVKLSPKKLINGVSSVEPDSNSDTGLSSLGEDMTQLGTLV